MANDSAAIRSVLRELPDLPTEVRDWRVVVGLDATDDPAVWIWALVEHDDVEPQALRQLKAMARKAVRETTDLWPYVLIRGADEDDEG